MLGSNLASNTNLSLEPGSGLGPSYVGTDSHFALVDLGFKEV